MSNLFGILAAILLAVTAFLSYKNKDAYQEQVNQRQAEERYRDQAEQTLKATTKDRDDTQGELNEREEKNVKLAEDESNQKALVEDLTSQKDNKKSLAESKTAEAAAKQEIIDKYDGVPQLVEKMQTLTSQKNELATQIAAAQSQIIKLEGEESVSSGKIQDRSDKIRRYTLRQSDPDLKTRISKVMRTWGFVTLAGGDSVGIVKDSTLDVIRNGEKVGEVVVTAVEANTAGASIVPTESGQPALYPGDLVVSQISAQPAPVSAPAPAATSIEAADPGPINEPVEAAASVVEDVFGLE